MQPMSSCIFEVLSSFWLWFHLSVIAGLTWERSLPSLCFPFLLDSGDDLHYLSGIMEAACMLVWQPRGRVPNETCRHNRIGAKGQGR